jgi:hypothetical protein
VSCSNTNGYLRNYQDCLTLGPLGPHHVRSPYYGHNIVVRLHGFFCTVYTIIYVRFLYPICTPYVGYIKSKFFQKSQKKKKIGQKKQKRSKNSKKPKRSNWPKKPKLAKIRLFVKFWLFWIFFSFFGNFWLFWLFLDFLEQVAVCHFGGYIRTT